MVVVDTPGTGNASDIDAAAGRLPDSGLHGNVNGVNEGENENINDDINGITDGNMNEEEVPVNAAPPPSLGKLRRILSVTPSCLRFKHITYKVGDSAFSSQKRLSLTSDQSEIVRIGCYVQLWRASQYECHGSGQLIAAYRHIYCSYVIFPIFVFLTACCILSCISAIQSWRGSINRWLATATKDAVSVRAGFERRHLNDTALENLPRSGTCKLVKSDCLRTQIEISACE